MENGNEKQGVLPIVSCIVSILEIHVSIWEKKIPGGLLRGCDYCCSFGRRRIKWMISSWISG